MVSLIKAQALQRAPARNRLTTVLLGLLGESAIALEGVLRLGAAPRIN